MKMIDSIEAQEEDRKLIPYREWKNFNHKIYMFLLLKRVNIFIQLQGGFVILS